MSYCALSPPEVHYEPPPFSDRISPRFFVTVSKELVQALPLLFRCRDAPVDGCVCGPSFHPFAGLLRDLVP